MLYCYGTKVRDNVTRCSRVAGFVRHEAQYPFPERQGECALRCRRVYDLFRVCPSITCIVKVTLNLARGEELCRVPGDLDEMKLRKITITNSSFGQSFILDCPF